MNAWLTVDFVAKRYGVLPSQLMREGSTIDVAIANLGVEYESWIHKKHEKGHTAAAPSQDQLKGMLDRVRNKSK